MSSPLTKTVPAIKFLLAFYLLIISQACYSQSKNDIQLANFFYKADYSDEPAVLNSIQKIDSIAHTTGIAGHFGRVYSKSMEYIAARMKGADGGAKNFIERFEIGFADYFVDACMAEKNGNFSPVWKCYFSSSSARPWQLVLLGVNAHINGDMWQALVDNFSVNEIRRYRRQFLVLQSDIIKGYHPLFDTILTQNGYLRFMNAFTKGLAKKFGERILYKWRRRQLQLAILFYHDPEKFRKKLSVVKRKKQKIDEMILRK